MKTYNEWDENPSNGNLSTYLGEQPCEIDEELYMYIAEVTSPTYSSTDFIQTGEASFSKHGVLHYWTCSNIEGKYYYLGNLPTFAD